MSKGGGSSSTQKQTTTSEPWAAAQPYLTDIMKRGQQLSQQQPSYYQGQTYVGPTDAEGAAWQQQANYNNSVFGGQPSLQYGSLTGYANNSIAGNNQLGQMSGQMAPNATGVVNQAFSPYNVGGRFDSLQGPNGSVREATPQAGQIGQYNFGTTLDAQGNSPQYGKAGSLDATGAYNRMLSGQPDYQGTQGAIDAANSQVMRQLTDQIVPQLNQQATFSNNMTGGVKGLNAAMPEIAQRMSENAQNINNQERIRALQSQENAAGQIAQGGMQSYGLGLQTAQGQRGLEQSQQNLNLSADQARANMGMSDAQMGLQTDMARYGINNDQANFGLQREQARESAMGGYRSDALGYGNLAGNLASQSAGDQARAASMFPGIYDMGRQPSGDSMAYANYDRAIQEDALQSDVDRFNYMRDQPMDQLGWYSNLVSGTASPYGSQTTTSPGGSRTAGALGGAMAGYQATQGLPWWAQMGGAMLGGASGGGWI
jgi:hypothetical protein